MFRIIVHEYILTCFTGGLPKYFEAYREEATLVDEIDLMRNLSSTEDICFLAVQKEGEGDWPFLVVTQKYAPSGLGASYPQALLIPETGLLFIGAGERVLIYRLAPPEKIGQGSAEPGFQTFKRHGQYIVMRAEQEIAVWTIQGKLKRVSIRRTTLDIPGRREKHVYRCHGFIACLFL